MSDATHSVPNLFSATMTAKEQAETIVQEWFASNFDRKGGLGDLINRIESALTEARAAGQLAEELRMAEMNAAVAASTRAEFAERELQEARAATAWQPIETLKGDEWYGRSVLVYVPENRCQFMVSLRTDGALDWFGRGVSTKFEYTASHWRRLSAPPGTAQKSGEER